MRRFILLGLVSLLPLVGQAQAPAAGTWGGSLALGNGVAVHGGYLAAGHCWCWATRAETPLPGGCRVRFASRWLRPWPSPTAASTWR